MMRSVLKASKRLPWLVNGTEMAGDGNLRGRRRRRRMTRSSRRPGSAVTCTRWVTTSRVVSTSYAHRNALCGTLWMPRMDAVVIDGMAAECSTRTHWNQVRARRPQRCTKVHRVLERRGVQEVGRNPAECEEDGPVACLQQPQPQRVASHGAQVERASTSGGARASGAPPSRTH